MRILPNKQLRKAYARRAKDFWADFRRNRIGLASLAILIILIFTAALARWITPYDPINDRDLAEPMAMPEWVTLLPQYRDLPRTINLTVNWSVAQGIELVNVYRDGEFVLRYNGNGTQTDVNLTMGFSYPYSPPSSFVCVFRWQAEQIKEMGYSLELILGRQASSDQQYSLWDSYNGINTRESSVPMLTKEKQMSFVRVSSSGTSQRIGVDTGQDVAKKIFPNKGEYNLIMRVQFRPESMNATAQVRLKDGEFEIPGLVHGVLGTDKMGSDLFSQLINGIGISMVIGLVTALLTTSIGTTVGVVSGYMGGAVDDVLMRVLDIMLCIPALPILITLVSLFGKNVFYIVFLIAIFTWPGLARIVRSQVLSLREMSFIESARAVGARKSYIIFKHVLPNVLPVAFASMVLTVPTAILTEASLSFLGLGDPYLVTWGRMISSAFDGGAFRVLAWWWLVPPGLAITVLCLSFVGIGQALDELMNPKLRRRR